MDRDTIDTHLKGATAYMSNSKWKKLFDALHAFSKERPLCGMKAKFIGDERHFSMGIYKSEELIDNNFGDTMPYPYGTLREIEWYEIPLQYSDTDAKRTPIYTENPLSDIEIYLEKIAKFPLEFREDALRIVGYKWGSI